MNTWIDEATGRRVRQLTEVSGGARVPYFRLPRHLPDGRVLVHGKHERGTLLVLDPASGEAEPVAAEPGQLLRLREDDGCAWFYDGHARTVLRMVLPDGALEEVGRVPQSVEGDVADITCDGRTLLGTRTQCEPSDIEGLFSGEIGPFWRWIYRKRSATMWAFDLTTGRLTDIVDMPGFSFQHIDTSPMDPGLLKYAQDGLAVFDQRAHAVRIDGTDARPIRPQAPGEWVHHEFWWPGGQLIGYKYMDRRNDATLHLRPWGEYAPRPLHLGIADLSGAEVYCSDPLAHYHSHLNVSADGTVVTGEGTHDYSFVCAAAFEMTSTHIDLQPLAAIHTPYRPASGQGVEAQVSLCGRWVVYNDTVEGTMQVCAVEL